MELYQLAPEPASLMQCYVLKTEHNKLIVIDGGIDGYGKNAPPYLTAALRAIAGVEEGEYFEVEAWFFSHSHGDHFGEFCKMMQDYTAESNYKVNHFYFDFPPYDTPVYPYPVETKMLPWLIESLDHYAKVNGIEIPAGKTYYDVLNGAMINQQAIDAGLTLNIDGVKIDVHKTWDIEDKGAANNESIVMRFHVGDKTVLFLNDLGTEGSMRYEKMPIANVKSDIIQTAHHGQAGAREPVYRMVGGSVFLWPTPDWVWRDPVTFRIGETRTWIEGEDFYEKSEKHIVACKYDAYPEDPTSIDCWKKVKDGMRVL